MKLAALLENHPIRLLFFQISLLLATWLVLGFLISHLAPPIPCNTFIEGANCVPRQTTLFLCLHILRDGFMLGVVVSSMVRFLSSARVATKVFNPAQRMSLGVYLVVALYLGVFCVMAIVALVQAG